MEIRLIHVTAELPPAVGGVADYTTILSRRLVERSDETVKPVLVHAGNREADAIEVNFPVTDLSGQCSASALADTIEALAAETDRRTVVLLEYSGYGYAVRGAPLWLERGLRRVCGEDGIPLITMFHELYATGPPWTSAFWLSPLQAYVATLIGRLSSAVVTNRAPSSEWLRSRIGSTPIRTQPIFSNVGELEALPPFEERGAYAAVFGGQGMKQELYEVIGKRRVPALRRMGIEKIVDLGRSVDGLSSVQGLSVEDKGVQPAETISKTLSQATIGLLKYPVDYLTKSGIWSSYAAHGLPTLVFSESGSTNTLEERRHFVRWGRDETATEGASLQEMGREAWEWYQTEANSHRVAETFLSLMKSIDLHDSS